MAALHHSGAEHLHDVGMLHGSMELGLARQQRELVLAATPRERSLDDESWRRALSHRRARDEHFRGSTDGELAFEDEGPNRSGSRAASD